MKTINNINDKPNALINNDQSIITENNEEGDVSFDSPHSRLMFRLQENMLDYKDSLLNFGKQEIIEMCGNIQAMSDAYFYITNSYDLSDDEIDFYLQFQNPLEVIADDWYEQKADLSDLYYSLEALISQKDKYLAKYPLMIDADTPVDNSLRRFMGVNLNEFLGKIAEKIIIYYPGDFNHDLETLNESALSDDPIHNRMIWQVSSYGTFLSSEHNVFIKDSGDSACITEYRQHVPDMFAYIIEVTGKNGDNVIGNVFEISNYDEYIKHITEHAQPAEAVTLHYSDEWGINAGKALKINHQEYLSNSKKLMYESGDVLEVEYHPKDKLKHEKILSNERSKRMLYPIGSMKRHLLKLTIKLADIRSAKDLVVSEPSTGRTSISDRIRKGNEKKAASLVNRQQDKENKSLSKLSI